MVKIKSVKSIMVLYIFNDFRAEARLLNNFFFCPNVYHTQPSIRTHTGIHYDTPFIIGAFGAYRVIGHVCLSLCPFVCSSIIYETATARKVNFCGSTIYVY